MTSIPSPFSIARFLLGALGTVLLPLALLAPSCDTAGTGPCTDYCDYICECHPSDGDVTCDDCRTIYTDDDASLQDECETSLTDLENADAEAGTGCPLG